MGGKRQTEKFTTLKEGRPGNTHLSELEASTWHLKAGSKGFQHSYEITSYGQLGTGCPDQAQVDSA